MGKNQNRSLGGNGGHCGHDRNHRRGQPGRRTKPAARLPTRSPPRLSWPPIRRTRPPTRFSWPPISPRRPPACRQCPPIRRPWQPTRLALTIRYGRVPRTWLALPQVIIVRPTHFAAPTSPEPAGVASSSGGLGPGGSFVRGGSFGPGGTFGSGNGTQKEMVTVRYGELNSRSSDIRTPSGQSYHREIMLAKAYPFARLIQRAYEASPKAAAH